MFVFCEEEFVERESLKQREGIIGKESPEAEGGT